MSDNNMDKLIDDLDVDGAKSALREIRKELDAVMAAATAAAATVSLFGLSSHIFWTFVTRLLGLRHTSPSLLQPQSCGLPSHILHLSKTNTQE
jgi:hypothetical protein